MKTAVTFYIKIADIIEIIHPRKQGTAVTNTVKTKS